MTYKSNSRNLYVPEPSARPGEPVDFSHFDFGKAGTIPRPEIDTPEHQLRSYPFELIRTLDSSHNAVGDWLPTTNSEGLLRALKTMCINREFDDRFFKLQRQGKTSFYMKSRGEEALSVVPSLALRTGDMCFPSYRAVGWLMARDYPMIDLVNQIFNNVKDPLCGRQMPILYSARDYGFYSISGNVGSRFGHSVGWAMAKAYRGTDDIAIGFIGDGTTAEGDFHEALTFASVYRAPVILCVTNNQWAISSFSGIAGANQTTFAAKALGYGIPGLRVDGNDALAVWAAVDWAAERARAGLGAVLIEFFTYRADAHSTSDDPSKYRPKDEAAHWPLGDPIDRLKAYLIGNEDWSEDQHQKMLTEIQKEVVSVIKQGEAVGTLHKAKPSVKEMFEGTFEEPDWRIIEQRGEMGI